VGRALVRTSASQACSQVSSLLTVQDQRQSSACTGCVVTTLKVWLNFSVTVTRQPPCWCHLRIRQSIEVDLACPVLRSASSQRQQSVHWAAWNERQLNRAFLRLAGDMTHDMMLPSTATTLLAVLHYAGLLGTAETQDVQPEHQATKPGLRRLSHAAHLMILISCVPTSLSLGISARATTREGEGSRHLRTTPTAYCWRFRRQYTPSTHNRVYRG
jgi:hypothetical protein